MGYAEKSQIGFDSKIEWYKSKKSNKQKSEIENNASLSDAREDVHMKKHKVFW